MTTKFTSKEAAEQARKWILVDAAGMTLGRLATEVAHIMRGKHRTTYTPHIDDGDCVVVVNAEKVVLTGNKLADKTYYRHTHYLGGLKTATAEEIFRKDPTELITKAVGGMIPTGKLGRQIRTKLKVYTGSDHPHKAQAPEVYKFRFAKKAA